MNGSDRSVGIDLYWIPLGAGGNGFVRFNGQVYERAKAAIDRRRACDLYHTALVVLTPEGKYVVETAWPSPDANTTARGVTVEGPVFSRRLARYRPFRYEVRRWRDGIIPDLEYAVGGPHRVTDDPATVTRLLAHVEDVPQLVWGRDERGTGEMWNSNSVIAWLLTRVGMGADRLVAPEGGRAPGWLAGIAVAGR